MIAIAGFEFFTTVGAEDIEGVGLGVGVSAEDDFAVGVGLAVGDAAIGIGVAVFDALPGMGTNGFDITGEGVGVAVFAVEVGVKPAKAPVGKRTLVTTHKLLMRRNIFLIELVTKRKEHMGQRGRIRRKQSIGGIVVQEKIHLVCRESGNNRLTLIDS
jgi:hypothetical protein